MDLKEPLPGNNRFFFVSLNPLTSLHVCPRTPLTQEGCTQLPHEQPLYELVSLPPKATIPDRFRNSDKR